MNAITSIYIPRIDTVFNAEFIADVFDRNGIAQVGRVLLEPNKNHLDKYNRVYIGINSWHDTESAFNFIARLRNPNREARLVYSDDNWWPVYINTKPNKLLSNNRVLTIFEEKYMDFCHDELSVIPVVKDELEELVHIDTKKTELLRSIVAGFKKQPHDDVDSFDGYLREMDEERNMWFSEQNIYDALYL
jgi:hypothetical protein